MKKIAVVIPVYNSENFICEAVDSVLGQIGIEAEQIRVVVVNDNSIDGTAKALKKYEADSRVTIITHEKNTGVATARNDGVKAADGADYIAFLDSDDWWSPSKIARQLELMELTDAPLICTARALHEETGEATGRVIGVPDTISYDDLLKTNFIPCGSVLIKRGIALEFPFVMDNLHEDYICWLRVTKKYGPAKGINEAMLHCRLAKGGKSRNKLKSARMHYGVFRYLGFSVAKSMRLTISYAVNGVRKYYG